MTDAELWNRAYAYTAANEGGWSDHAADRGGATRYGISSRSYPTEDIANLSRERAKYLLQRDFWITPRFDEIRPERVAIKVFDFGVVAGPPKSAQILQRACNRLGADPALIVDGKCGDKTLRAVRHIASTLHGESRLLAELTNLQSRHFSAIILRNPSQQVFAKGWRRRAVRLPEEVVSV